MNTRVFYVLFGFSSCDALKENCVVLLYIYSYFIYPLILLIGFIIEFIKGNNNGDSSIYMLGKLYNPIISPQVITHTEVKIEKYN